MKQFSPKKTIFSLIILGVFGLAFYNTKDIFFGTPFSVQSATNGSTVSDAFLPISGNAKHATTVEINGRQIAIDTTGAFADGVVLSPGYNIIEISQTDRFGKERRKVLHLVAEPSNSMAQAMNIYYQ